jgi:hypothetical protein
MKPKHRPSNPLPLQQLAEHLDAEIEMFRRRTTRGALSGEITKPDFIAELYDARPPLLRYLARAAVDGGPAAAAVLDELAAGAEEFRPAPGLSDFRPVRSGPAIPPP